ncbi:MAG: hypothetical protein GKR89_21860 [Candidatus Latescibacteria bacterium]|nr:hypothetical protein [Candidatus Latescibacterota bacterium]
MHWKLYLSSLAVLLAAAYPLAAQKATPAGPAGGAANVLEEGHVFNIIDWDGGNLPQLYERSDQLPLKMADVAKLVDNGFSTEAIVKMIQERRCQCDASVDGLVALKKAGAAEAVIQAVSLHALPPNRQLNLIVTMDFEGLGGQDEVSTQARKGYLYLIIPDGDRERVFMGNLQTILAGRWQRDGMVDNTDLLLPKKVRRIVFSAEVPLKTYGPRTALVFTSTKPDIYTSADIPPADRAGVQEYPFDYPESSLQRQCTLQVLHRQDALLADKWHLQRAHFQCEWD